MQHEELATLIASQQDRFASLIATAARGLTGTIYETMSESNMQQMTATITASVIAHLKGEQPIEVFAERITMARVADPNYTPDSISRIIGTIDSALLTVINEAYQPGTQAHEDALLAAKDLVLRDTNACYTTYSLARERALHESVAEQSRLIDILRDLSSPIIPVHDSILVLPLVGTIDTRRAQIVTEDLLSAIVDRQADLVIIDITGVPIVDTAIANYLLQTTKAVDLLGAHSILVGISAEVAQTLVGLELDLNRLTIRANLQDGIAFALESLGLHITPFESATV